MDWASQDFLVFLAIIPMYAAIVAWAAARKLSDVARIGTPSLIASLSPSVSVTRRRLKTLFWLVALAALIIALARPRWGRHSSLSSRQGVQVMMAVDVSSSMLAEDSKPSRLCQAKAVAVELIIGLSGNDLGLVLFSGAAFVQVPLTPDIYTALDYLRAAQAGMVSRDGTALEEAIRVAQSGFPKSFSTNQVIVMLTDGESHEGNPLRSADAAADTGTSFFFIGFGSQSGAPIPLRDESGTLIDYKRNNDGERVQSWLHEGLLQQLAATTNGRYLRSDSSTVSTVIEAISALDAGELENTTDVRLIERYQWFAGLAFLLLTAEYLIGDRAPNRSRWQKRMGISIVGSWLFIVACAPNAVHHNSFGNDLFYKTDYSGAAAADRRAQVDDPDRAELYYNAANAYYRLGKLEPMLAQGAEALKVADPELASDTWYNLGNAYFDLENWAAAIGAYKQALRINDKDGDAKHNLELALKSQSEAAAPEEETTQPSDGQSRDSFGQPGPPTESGLDGALQNPEQQSIMPRTLEPGASNSEQMKQDGGTMTVEQASQLLESLAASGAMRQLGLGQIHRSLGTPSEKDW